MTDTTAQARRQTPVARLFTKLFRNEPAPAVRAPRPQRPRERFRPDDHAAIYAIGDVHGCYEELVDAERRILADAVGIDGPKLIVLLGDYVDRGKRSREVLDHLCTPPPAGFTRIALCGNHDDLFLRFLHEADDDHQWLECGGRETLHSYGIDPDYLMQRNGGRAALAATAKAAVPARHIELLRSMPGALAVGDIIFAHAGLRPGVPLEAQRDRDLLWIREPFLSRGPGASHLVVHGHTPNLEPVFGPGRIGIDTAAFATGKLTVLKIACGETALLAPR